VLQSLRHFVLQEQDLQMSFDFEVLRIYTVSGYYSKSSRRLRLVRALENRGLLWDDEIIVNERFLQGAVVALTVKVNPYFHSHCPIANLLWRSRNNFLLHRQLVPPYPKECI